MVVREQLEQTHLLSYIKTAKAKWMKMFPSLSASAQGRIAQSAGTTAPALKGMVAGSKAKGLPAATRGVTLKSDPMAQGIHKGDEAISSLHGMRSADALSRTRHRMSTWDTPDSKIIRQNRAARSSTNKGFGVEHTNEMGLLSSHYTPGEGAVIGTRDAAEISRKFGPRAEHAVRGHEIGEGRGALNHMSRDWHRAEAASDLRSAKLPKDVRSMASRQISSETSPIANPTQLVTPISAHNSAVPLAAEYASVVGNPQGERFLKGLRGTSGEGVQSGLLRQYGMVNPHSAEAGRVLSPSRDARLTRRISGEYQQRLQAMSGDPSQRIPMAELMNDARFRQARLLNKQLPSAPPVQLPSPYAQDAFGTGGFQAFGG